MWVRSQSSVSRPKRSYYAHANQQYLSGWLRLTAHELLGEDASQHFGSKQSIGLIEQGIEQKEKDDKEDRLRRSNKS
jgi:hypothetical protein